MRRGPPGSESDYIRGLTPDVPDLVVRSRRLLVGDRIRPGAVHVRDGRIAGLAGPDEAPAGVPIYDAGDAVVMPGLIDPHVHVNEPGRTEWEGFATATRAAAAGGVTTIVDMPLNSRPATTSCEALREKRSAAQGQLWVDVGFWGGVVPGNLAACAGLHEEGVLGFKCFLAPSGIADFPHVGERALHNTCRSLARLRSVLLVHAEMAGPIQRATLAARRHGRPDRYETWLASRPEQAEGEAIDLLVRMSRETGVRIHVVHLSAAAALPLLERARAEGLPITVETCPHYLTFAAEEIADQATAFKCAPPIRARGNREALWQAVLDGRIDLVASDHSPCPPAMKGGDFLSAWGGIVSLELGLSAVWTGLRARGGPFERIAGWMAAAPAQLAGLAGRKGAIAPGLDADLVVWRPEGSFEVEASRLHQRHKLTPYAGRLLHGVVEATFLRGRLVYERDGAGGQARFAERPFGQVLNPRLNRCRGSDPGSGV